MLKKQESIIKLEGIDIVALDSCYMDGGKNNGALFLGNFVRLYQLREDTYIDDYIAVNIKDCKIYTILSHEIYNGMCYMAEEIKGLNYKQFAKNVLNENIYKELEKLKITKGKDLNIEYIKYENGFFTYKFDNRVKG